MKNFDYIINKEYELLLLDSNFIRDKVMADFNLSNNDIQKYFLLNNKNNISPTVLFDGKKHSLYEYRHSIFENQDILDILLKKNLILDDKGHKYIKKLVDVKLNDEPLTENNTFFRDKYIYTYEKTTIEEYVKDILDIKEKNFNAQKIKENEHLNRAMESSVIVLNKTLDGKYELIDGFYRLLFKQLNRKVIVKVYSDLTDEEWTQLMITCNAWKIDNHNSLEFFDRGFLLGLKLRFDLDLDTYISYRTDKSIIKELYCYVNNLDSKDIYQLFAFNKEYSMLYEEIEKMKPNIKGCIRYSNMLSMKYFIDDFKILGNIFNYIPESLPEVIGGKFRKQFVYGYDYFIDNLITAICVVRATYKDKKQNKLEVKIIDELLSNKKIKESLNKALKMTIRGNIKNRIDSIFPECFKIVKDKLIID